MRLPIELLSRVTREVDDLTGPVRGILVDFARYTATEGLGEETEGRRRRLLEVTYDSQGLCARRTYHHFGPSGELEWRQVAVYQDGRPLQTVRSGPDGTVCGWTDHAYDAAGQQLSVTIHAADGSVTGITRYCAQGDEVTETVFGPDGSGRLRVARVYDDAGRPVVARYHAVDGALRHRVEDTYVGDTLVGRRTYDGSGALTSRSRREQDPAGRLVDVSERCSGDVWFTESRIYLDEQGRETAGTLFQADGSVREAWARHYDGQGNLIEETWTHGDGSPGGRTFRRYDSGGREVEKVEWEGSGPAALRTSYARDAWGNWTQEVVAEERAGGDGLVFYPVCVTYRVITYEV